MLPCPGDLKAEAVQRFETYEDLQKHHVTVEEREEYEQHLRVGTTVYAGVDYKAILRQVGEQHQLRSENWFNKLLLQVGMHSSPQQAHLMQTCCFERMSSLLHPACEQHVL